MKHLTIQQAWLKLAKDFAKPRDESVCGLSLWQEGRYICWAISDLYKQGRIHQGVFLAMDDEIEKVQLLPSMYRFCSGRIVANDILRSDFCRLMYHQCGGK